MSLFKDAKPEDFKVVGSDVETIAVEDTAPEQSEDTVSEVTEETPTVEAEAEATEQPEQGDTTPEALSFEEQFKQHTQGKYESLDDMIAALENKSDEPKDEYKFKDDFIKDVVSYYEKTGDLTPYLEAKLVDYNAMSSEQVMRHRLKKEYGGLSDRAFDKLYKREVVDKYKLDIDEYDEDEVSLGRELLDVEAGKHKAAYINEQDSFKAPESESKNQEQEIAEHYEKWAKVIGENSDTKKLSDSKSLVWGKDEDNQFHYEVKPDELVEMAVDNQKFFNLFAGKQGNVDLDKWYRVAAFAQDPDAFVKALITHGKSMGEEKIIETVKNPSKPQKNKVSTDYDDSDFSSGLLNAFAKKVS
jgi:hypothetical protein